MSTATVQAAPKAKQDRRSNHPAALRDGIAEARLLAIYRLIAQGRHQQALQQTQALVRDHPNFQLAQLTLGDLLMARSGMAPRMNTLPPGAVVPTELEQAQATLQALRTESRQRVQAQQHPPLANTIPAQFLALPESTRHAIAVDASRSRLYLFQNSATGMQLVADYYVSVGKLGTDKNIEGDQRTPLGVYFITSRLDPASLKDFYGAGALPINYPNPLDQSRGKTGSGIWLHGTPPDQFARAPLATDGCVAMANPDLERLLRTVEPRATPVVIAKQLHWVRQHSMQAQRASFDAVLEAWAKAKSDGDMQRLIGFYANNFESNKDAPLQEWSKTLQQESHALRGRTLTLKDKTYLHWSDANDTMIVTFGEVAQGARTGKVRRQYWTRQGQHWQIFYEGVIG